MDTSAPGRPSRSSLSAVYARSPLDVPWRGVPGPVWTIMIGALLYAIMAVVAVVARPESDASDAVLLATAVCSLLAVAVLAFLRARTPLWLLHVQIFVVIGLTDVLVLVAPNPVAAVNVTFRYLAISLYVAWWMTWRMTAIVLVLISVTSLACFLVRNDEPTNLVLTWMLVTVLSWALAILIQYLTRSIARHATIDPLTGMLNRSALARLIDLSQEPGRVVLPRTLVVVDLDDFKRLNDTHGHLAGDRALSDLGAAWRQSLRADDIAVRSGGDEFLLILPKTTTAEAQSLVERLQSASGVPWSYGLADWPAHEDFDLVIARADAELYRAKRSSSL